MVPINYMAVVAAAVAAFLFGWAWHAFFSKQWLALSGKTSEQIEKDKAKGMLQPMGLALFASLLTAYVMAHVLEFAWAYFPEQQALGAGLMVAFWNWVGFVVPITMNDVLWLNRSWKFWAFNAVYILCTFVVMALILAFWR